MFIKILYLNVWIIYFSFFGVIYVILKGRMDDYIDG